MASRDEIVQAAIQVFGRKGYDRATLDDIAELVGIRKPSLYHHIDSKEELLWEIHQKLQADAIRTIEVAIRDEDEPPQQLRRVIRALTLFVGTRALEVDVFLREIRRLPPDKREQTLADRGRILDLITPIIRKGIAAGDFQAVDPQVTTFGILGMIYWIREWIDAQEQFELTEVADSYGDLVLLGLILQ